MRAGLLWLVFLAAMLGVVLRFGEIENFALMARRAKPLWLLGAIAMQAVTYVTVSMGWALVLARAGSPKTLGQLLPVALVKLFADQTVPTAGLGGNIILVERLMALGVSRGHAVAALLISIVGFYAAYSALALVLLVILWLDGRATPMLAGVVTIFLIVALAIPSLALWLRVRGSRPLSPRLERLAFVRRFILTIAEAPADLVRDRALIARVAACNALVFLADAATLMLCLAALGEPLRPITAFVASMTASIVATLGPVPMGLGTFEATSIAMLSTFGVGLEAALAATLLMRGLTLWLPLIPGFVLARRGADFGKG